jgi:hypothetical protein
MVPNVLNGLNGLNVLNQAYRLQVCSSRRDCRNSQNFIGVMLSTAKHLLWFFDAVERKSRFFGCASE